MATGKLDSQEIKDNFRLKNAQPQSGFNQILNVFTKSEKTTNIQPTPRRLTTYLYHISFLHFKRP